MNLSTSTILVTLIFLLQIAGINAQEKELGRPFSLEESIAYALENNANVKNAIIEMDIAKAKVGETTADGLPQVNISGRITNNYNVRNEYINPRAFNPDLPEGLEVPAAFGLQYTGDVSLGVTQMLFDGSYFVGLKAARTYKELSEKDFAAAKIDVIDAVTKAYYLSLVSQERLDLIRANLIRYDTLLYETEIMLENGFVENIDVSRLKVLNNNTKVTLQNAEEIARSSYDLLKFHMGIPIQEEIRLTDQLTDIVFEYQDEPDQDFDYNQRIEYSQLYTNLQLVELQRKNNAVKYLPSLSLFANIGYNNGTDFSDRLFDFSDRWISNGNFGISLSIPVFDGFRKSFMIQQNKMQMEQIKNQMDLMKNNIDMEIITATNTLKVAIENLKAQKENMELAQEIYDISEIKYQEGVGSNSEVVEAATSYKESQTNYYNALYDALISKTDLEKASGKIQSNK